MGAALSFPPAPPSASARSSEANRAEAIEADSIAVRRVANGDLSALGSLFDRHHAAVRRFLQGFTNGSADVDDLVQETFLIAAKRAGSFRSDLPVRPWLLGIAAHLGRRNRRTFVRFVRMLERFATGGEEPQTAPHPLEQRAESQAVQLALTRLSEAKRAVVLMVEVEGRSCAEAAEALGVPIGTVWTRLHHARKELREALLEEVAQ